jgi:hypothetical protein
MQLLSASATALFHVALAPPAWAGSAWLGGHTSLRTEFTLAQPPAAVAAAALYASGVGCFQLSLNGELVADSVSPGRHCH